MKRRHFNQIALGAGLSPFLSNPTLAQWYEGPSPPTQPPPQKFNVVIKHSPRTYNQVNVPRKSAAGRRFTIYWALFARSQGGTVTPAGGNTWAPRSVRLDLRDPLVPWTGLRTSGDRF